MNRAAAYFVTLYTAVGDRIEGRRDRGATAVEYGLLVGLIAVAIIAALLLLGPKLAGLFNDVATKLPGTAAGAGAGG
ncbi:Flp family type IVb pilin [Georgenia yuyongxinii]|uniref:Flp family type IVb pilin n=1 Tax=Georgenia yuyongxinii TaxID=2589797 RepID=A0A552WJK4_9MICO|nr:Flp family type IVb pilin [Georgenia yuyongxinii]TRW42941.1 Flp family type IVb pilin [Georgenia yuyongxinii]